MNNEVGKKEINVWEKFFTVIDIFCRILVLLTTDFTDCTEEYSYEFDVDGLETFGYKKDSV